MKNQLLLLEDVEGIGRSGDLVSVKPGFARNFLLPQQKAIIPAKHTVQLQEKLKEERAKKSIVDKKDAEILAQQLVGTVVKAKVKIDPEGHMYGSVGQQDIVNLLKEQCNIALEKKNVILLKPFKKLGVHEVILKLKEGIPATIHLEISAEESLPQ